VSVIQFGCPFCGAVAEVDADQAGQETVCPACESPLVVPEPESPTLDGDDAGPLADPPTKKAARPKPSAPRSKPKLWQAPPPPEASGASGVPSPELPQPVTPRAPDPDADLFAASPLDDPLGGLAEASPLGFEEPVTGAPYSRRASEIARQELERRRFWSNVVMLAASIIILFGVLGGLMYFNG
jgi:hypothetical protein